MRRILAIAAVLLVSSVSVAAQDGDFIAGLAVSGGLNYGSSNTKNGGAAFAGGGIVRNLTFDGVAGLGGYVGVRLRPSLSAFISYQHLRGGVSWDAEFPAIGVASSFRGFAHSNIVMGNLGYDWTLSDRTMLRARGGLGLAMNAFAGLVETDRATGQFLAEVASSPSLSPAAEIGAGIAHRFTRNAEFSLNAAVGYVGGFRTGDTRTGNLGVTAITPYEVDHVWRVSLGASVRYLF